MLNDQQFSVPDKDYHGLKKKFHVKDSAAPNPLSAQEQDTLQRGWEERR